MEHLFLRLYAPLQRLTVGHSPVVHGPDPTAQTAPGIRVFEIPPLMVLEPSEYISGKPER